MGSAAELTNSRGDTLGQGDKDALFARDMSSPGSGATNLGNHKQAPGIADPVRRSELLMNWLTAGGPPKAIDPSKIFGDAQAMAGVNEKASVGAGINGLFGIGNVIGDLSPKLQSIKPLNLSPMQPNVAYGAVPVPKIGG